MVPRHDDQCSVQPGPYCAVDAGPLRLVLVDTGLTGRVDRAQAAGCGRCPPPQAQDPARRPTHVRRGPSAPDPLDSGGDLNEIVTDPGTATSPRSAAATTTTSATPCGFATAATIQYVVAGFPVRPCSATHRIPNVDRLEPAVSEDGFRCYPLRGDSLARFSRPIAACSASAASRSAPAMRRRSWPERIGDAAARPSTPSAEVPARARRAAGQVYPLPATGRVLPTNRRPP